MTGRVLGGAAAWPLAARAQQRDRVWRIGVLNRLAADDPEGQARLAAFAQGLQQLGLTIGRIMRMTAARPPAIDDGFLTPFEVKQISTTLDEYVSISLAHCYVLAFDPTH